MFIRIAKEMQLTVKQVETVALLLDEGATVPFIARYRKEATGSLDEVAVTTIRDRLLSLMELTKRREAILHSLTERNLLTEALSLAINQATNMTVLEDVYLPYRPKRRTRATMARERGLEPLAQWLMQCMKTQCNDDPANKALEFIKISEDTTDKDSMEKNVPDVAAALAGARDIIAEEINEDSLVRQNLRTSFSKDGVLRCSPVSGKEEEGVKFRDYFTYEELSANIPSHRILVFELRIL